MERLEGKAGSENAGEAVGSTEGWGRDAAGDRVEVEE